MGCTYFMEDYFPKREKADDTNVDNALSPTNESAVLDLVS